MKNISSREWKVIYLSIKRIKDEIKTYKKNVDPHFSQKILAEKLDIRPEHFYKLMGQHEGQKEEYHKIQDKHYEKMAQIFEVRVDYLKGLDEYRTSADLFKASIKDNSNLFQNRFEYLTTLIPSLSIGYKLEITAALLSKTKSHIEPICKYGWPSEDELQEKIHSDEKCLLLLTSNPFKGDILSKEEYQTSGYATVPYEEYLEANKYENDMSKLLHIEIEVEDPHPTLSERLISSYIEEEQSQQKDVFSSVQAYYDENYNFTYSIEVGYIMKVEKEYYFYSREDMDEFFGKLDRVVKSTFDIFLQ